MAQLSRVDVYLITGSFCLFQTTHTHHIQERKNGTRHWWSHGCTSFTFSWLEENRSSSSSGWKEHWLGYQMVIWSSAPPPDTLLFTKVLLLAGCTLSCMMKATLEDSYLSKGPAAAASREQTKLKKKNKKKKSHWFKMKGHLHCGKKMLI